MRKNGCLWVLVLMAMVAITACKKGDKDKETTAEEVVVETPKPPATTITAAEGIATPELNHEHESLAIPAPTADFSGSYQGARAVLDIRKMSPELSRFSLQMHPSGECTGDMNGIVSMVTDNHGEYVEQDCTLSFDFGKQLVQIKEEGNSCHDHHSDGCSFSDDYRVGGVIKENKQENDQSLKDSLAGHYIHKNISIDGTRCKGWEIWLTGSNLALDAEVAIYAGACDAERIRAENLKYNAASSTLDFDALQEGEIHHFAGTFDNGSDLHGLFSY